MKKIAHLHFISVLLVFWLCPGSAQAAGSTSIILLQGQSKDVEMLFSIERATPVAEGIVTIRKAGANTLTISADAPGSTTIDVLGTDGERHQISVIIQVNLQRIMAEFEALVPASVIVSPLPLLGKLRAEGSFKDRAERADYLAALEMFDGMIVDQTRYSEMDAVKRSLEQRLPRGVMITFRPELNIIELDGVISSPTEWAKYQRVLTLYSGKGVRSIVVHEPGPEIFHSLRDDLARAAVPIAAYPNIHSGLRIIYKRELNAIVVEGELTSEDHLRSYQRVMGLYQGRGVKDMTTYEPGPEAIWSLKRNLENEGFVVTTDGTSGKNTPGVIHLHYTRGVLNISGSFHNPKQIKHIERIVHSQPWLTIAGGGEGGTGGRVRAVMNLEVGEEEFEVNIAFYQVGATHARTVGLNLAEQGLPSIDLLGFVTRKRGDTSTTRTAEYRVQSLMGGTINLSNGTSPGKLSSGTMLNVRTGAGPQSFHNGGTLIIPVSGQIGGTSSVSEIQHGIKGDIEAGMTPDGQVELTIDASLNAMPSAFGEAYTQEVLANFRNIRVTLPVGFSRVAGGHQIMEASRRKTGVPGADLAGFRNTSELYEDKHIVMLVSVHPVGQHEPGESALSKLFRYVPERVAAPLDVIQERFLNDEPRRPQIQTGPIHAIKPTEKRVVMPPPPPPIQKAPRRFKGGNMSRGARP